MFGFAQPFPSPRERLFFSSPRAVISTPLEPSGSPAPAFLTLDFSPCYHEKEMEGYRMSNRFYFTLMGICLIGIFFFLLKMLGTELQYYF